MELHRKFDLSIYYWLSGIVPAAVNVVDGFPSDSLTLPTVSVTQLDVTGLPFELGGDERDLLFWRIDTFGETKTQRDNLASLVYRLLECNIDVNNYDEGFPPTVTPSKIGTLLVTKRKLRPVHTFEQLVDKLYWRSSVTFFTRYQPI